MNFKDFLVTALRMFFIIFFLSPVFGAYLLVLRTYSWVCAQVSFLSEHWRLYGGLNWGQLLAKQMPYSLYCLSGPFYCYIRFTRCSWMDQEWEGVVICFYSFVYICVYLILYFLASHGVLWSSGDPTANSQPTRPALKCIGPRM